MPKNQRWIWAASGVLLTACGSGFVSDGNDAPPAFSLTPSDPNAMAASREPEPAEGADDPDLAVAGGRGETNLPEGTPLAPSTDVPDSVPPPANMPPRANVPTAPDACDFVPVSPNASLSARRLLCFLHAINGKSVLSGQQETSWRNPQGDIDYIFDSTGEYPAILGGDFLYPNGTTDRAIAYWNAGGIPMIRYHMGAPPLNDSYNNSMGRANIEAVLTDGTPEHTSFMAKLDFAAGELRKLQDAGAAVLWAPFHESQPNGWFWYAKGTADQLIQMWRLTFDYLTKTKGLNNLVWIFPSSGSPNASIFPGKTYADLAGPDTYGTNQPFTRLYTNAKGVFGDTMPIPLHETGTIPDPTAMFNGNAAPWVLFSVWAGYERTANSVDNLKRTYSHERTINRDQLPNFR